MNSIPRTFVIAPITTSKQGTEQCERILHRFLRINTRSAIKLAFDALRSIVDEVFPVELRDIERARQIVAEASRFSARDAIHLAVTERYGIGEIMTFDTAFDGIPGLSRISS